MHCYQHPQFLLQYFCHEQCALRLSGGLTSFLSTPLFCFSSSLWFAVAVCSAAPDKSSLSCSWVQAAAPLKCASETLPCDAHTLGCHHSWQRQLVVSADDDSGWCELMVKSSESSGDGLRIQEQAIGALLNSSYLPPYTLTLSPIHAVMLLRLILTIKHSVSARNLPPFPCVECSLQFTGVFPTARQQGTSALGSTHTL